jgi:hypothetical protein
MEATRRKRWVRLSSQLALADARHTTLMSNSSSANLANVKLLVQMYLRKRAKQAACFTI